jgi:curli biogenesis system outer membrane secretion channel CsgG
LLSRKLVTLAAIVCALASSSCGYALAGRGSFLPQDIRLVGIPQLVNNTTFFQIEQVLTEKIRAEFIGRGNYVVIPDTTGADAVITGQVTGLSVQPTGFTDQQLASRYIFTITMKVAFTDTRTNMVLWSNDSLSFSSEYELATRGADVLNASAFLDQERSSFDRIATDIARSVVTAITEAF